MKKDQQLVKASPPGNFKGSLECWKAQLQIVSNWDGSVEMRDLRIPFSEWQEILDNCESEIEEIEY